MEQIPKEIIRTICSLCNSAKLEGVKKVGAEELRGEIEEREKSKFTGVLRLNFKENGNLNSCYIIFLNGMTILTMKEIVSSTESSTFYTIPEAELREGALEILEADRSALERVARKLPERTELTEVTASTEPESPTPPEPKEISEDIIKFKEKILQDAEKAAGKVIEDLKPKISEKDLKAMKLPRQKCNKILEIIEEELKEVFGEIKAKNLIKLRLTEMKFNQDSATCAIVAELIEYLRNTAMKNKLGKEKADKIADKMLWRLAEIAEE